MFDIKADRISDGTTLTYRSFTTRSAAEAYLVQHTLPTDQVKDIRIEERKPTAFDARISEEILFDMLRLIELIQTGRYASDAEEDRLGRYVTIGREARERIKTECPVYEEDWTAAQAEMLKTFLKDHAQRHACP